MYRFGLAAAAIGMSEAALRNWMTRNKIDLWEQRPEGGWRQFSLRDVFVLSLVAELVSYGARVDQGVAAVQAALAEVPENEPINLPNPLYGSRTRFGDWELHGDPAMALHLNGGRCILKIFPMQVMSEANNRLMDLVRQGTPDESKGAEA
jgi:hypothetical protein